MYHMAGNELYRRFTALSSDNQDLLQRILGYLDNRNSLRLANKELLKALNKAVHRARWSITHAIGLQRDLKDVFPAAEFLRIECPQLPNTAGDVFVFLDCVETRNPRLFQTMTQLEIATGVGELGADVETQVLRLLTRCPCLTSFKLSWSSSAQPRHPTPVVCGFASQGSTLGARRTTMQQQLAAITSSPDFLAPASWPAFNCLTSLEMPNTPKYSSSWLQPACQTTTLVSLTLDCSGVAGLGGLEALSSCRNLTFLSVKAASPASAASLEGFSTAIASMPSLANLQLTGRMLHTVDAQGEHDFAQVPRSWSVLTSLTSLTMSSCRLRLSALPFLPALCVMDLTDSCTSGSLLQLSSLTALTRLRGGTRSMAEAAGQEGGAGGGVGVQRMLALSAPWPRPWVEGMVELTCSLQEDVRLIPQLTALTRLALWDLELNQVLCCGLARLPKLEKLSLIDVTIAEGQAAPQQHQLPFQPVLAKVRKVKLDIPTMACFSRLASWVAVPRLQSLRVGCTADDLLHDVWSMPYKAPWGAGWLPALHNNGMWASGTVVVLLQTDADVQRFAVDLGRRVPSGSSGNHDSDLRDRIQMAMALGLRVTGAAFLQLFQAPQRHLRLFNCCRPGYLDCLPSDFFRSLPGASAPWLQRLVLENCSSMQDRDLLAVAVATPALRSLALEHAVLLSDAGLCGLLCCRQLLSVHVQGCERITADGACTLLTTSAQLLDVLSLDNVESDAVAQRLRTEVWARPEAPSAVWFVEPYAVFHSGVLCQLREEHSPSGRDWGFD